MSTTLRVLIVKVSSLGDVIHTLPALSDAAQAHPNVIFDWVVEEGFQEIPTWHPQVRRVIPIALRRWKKKPYQALKYGEWSSFWQILRHTEYDLVIDAQGLLKSAWVTALARAKKRVGWSRRSAREPLASFFYQVGYDSDKQKHAIARTRELFAQALGYASPGQHSPQFQIQLPLAGSPSLHLEKPYVLFLHGTTWDTKLWPESQWITLGQWMNHRGYAVYLPWGNALEQERAQRIAAALDDALVLPRLRLSEMAHHLQTAQVVVALDSGLTHLAAALQVPTVALYGATDPKRTRPQGQQAFTLKSDLSCSPCLKKTCRLAPNASNMAVCMQALTPRQVWQQCLPYLADLQRGPSSTEAPSATVPASRELL